MFGRREENLLVGEFLNIDNRSLLWNLLLDNYGAQHIKGFESIFEKIVNGTVHQVGEFNNLMDMNKSCILEASTMLLEHITSRENTDHQERIFAGGKSGADKNTNKLLPVPRYSQGVTKTPATLSMSTQVSPSKPPIVPPVASIEQVKAAPVAPSPTLFTQQSTPIAELDNDTSTHDAYKQQKIVLEEYNKRVAARAAIDTELTNIKKKTSEFSGIVNKDNNTHIKFKVTQRRALKGKLNDLMSQQMSERNNDMREIVQKYDRTNATNWINNEVPPPLNIDHTQTVDSVKIDVLPTGKHVTFNLPFLEKTSPKNVMPHDITHQTETAVPQAEAAIKPTESLVPSFLEKLKKKAIGEKPTKASPQREEVHVLSLTPRKISSSTLFFDNINKFAKTICISKLFLPNTVVTTKNILNQEMKYKISDQMFIFCDIIINKKIRIPDILLEKKNEHDGEICFESDKYSAISEEVNDIEVTFVNKHNERLHLLPPLVVEHFIKGDTLHIKSEEHMPFYNNKLGYIILKDDMLSVGDKLLIDNKMKVVIGTCRIHKQDDYYHLESVIISSNDHNCIIIDWEEILTEKMPTMHRSPTFRFTIKA